MLVQTGLRARKQGRQRAHIFWESGNQAMARIDLSKHLDPQMAAALAKQRELAAELGSYSALPLERVRALYLEERRYWNADAPAVARIEARRLPGPTGESNRLSLFPRGIIVCTGPGASAAELQAAEARSMGCRVLAVAPGVRDGLDGMVSDEALRALKNIHGVVCWGSDDTQRGFRRALAGRDGPLIPLICTKGDPTRYCIERHICIDTTASGGNAALLAISE